MNASAITGACEPVTAMRLARCWGGSTNAMRSQFIWRKIGVMILALLIGWLDYITGYEVMWFVFYGTPIFLALWWLANMSTPPDETQVGYAWSLVNRQVMVFAVTALRTRHHRAQVLQANLTIQGRSRVGTRVRCRMQLKQFKTP
ncbi:MAG: hypothetical protein NTY98_00255 [Verrucomicrobia bacterium]|nr:hypothetical protein [Verrucomicrobiota bacterium]